MERHEEPDAPLVVGGLSCRLLTFRSLLSTLTVHCCFWTLLYCESASTSPERRLSISTIFASTARFSPDDKYSRHRVTLKKRFGLLLTQQTRKDD